MTVNLLPRTKTANVSGIWHGRIWLSYFHVLDAYGPERGSSGPLFRIFTLLEDRNLSFGDEVEHVKELWEADFGGF